MDHADVKIARTVYLLNNQNRYMRENAAETLLEEGTQFLSADSMKAILCDQEIDMDETNMFNMLAKWVRQDKDNIEAGKTLAVHLQLCYLKPDHLKYVVKKCGFVEPAAVDAALQEIEEALANESPEDKEHVQVTGAGQDGVDGVYVRLHEDIGMEEMEVTFVKEAAEEDDYGPDYSLFLRKSAWALTLSADSSNVLYSCKVPLGLSLPRPPEYGWQAGAGAEPAPTCVWSPSKAERGKDYVAPNLQGSNTSAKSVDNGDHAEGCSPQGLTLSAMMALPVDEDFDNDYCGTKDDDLMKMMTLAEDTEREEGEEDEEDHAAAG